MTYVSKVEHGDAGVVYYVGLEIQFFIKDDTKVSSCITDRYGVTVNDDALNGVWTALSW